MSTVETFASVLLSPVTIWVTVTPCVGARRGGEPSDGCGMVNGTIRLTHRIPLTVVDMTDHPTPLRGTDQSGRSGPTTDDADGYSAIHDRCDLPVGETVLVMPRGSYYHLPMGGSRLPVCDASSVPVNRITAQTRYNAAVEQDLEPCEKCMESAGVFRDRRESEGPPKAD